MTTAPTQTRIEEAVAVGRAGFISHFTPSMMIPQALEEIFVGRDELAAELVEQLESSALSEAKQHTLLIGPRGIGKSHLIALTYYRVKENPQVSERLRIAWLREEEYGVTSWLDLLLRIFRALEEEYPDTTPHEQLETLYDLKTAEAEREAERLLREYIGDKTLLLLIENLDEVFAGLKDKGQRQWRAFLQQYPICATLATSPSLFNGVARQTSPFYGFFRVRNLEPLTVEIAVNLLQKLALYRGDKELAEFIGTPAGRARVRAVHHLAGGNHRIYVIFSQFLDRRSLDELVGPFLNMLDELTPYYQSRMFLLSPQQRKMVEVLCAQRGAVTVKVLAHRGFMSQQTASSQLQDLRDKGYAISYAVGRESFYELREPMMRLCLEVKKQRGEPIGLFIQFLRVWYSREQLKRQLDSLPSGSSFERQYLAQAIEGLPEKGDSPTVSACRQDFYRSYREGDVEAALEITAELLALNDSAGHWNIRGSCQTLLGQTLNAVDSFSEAIKRDPNLASAYFQRAYLFSDLKKHEEALADSNQVVRLEPIWRSFFLRGNILGILGYYAEALDDFTQSLKLKSTPEEKGRSLAYKGLALFHLDRTKESIETFQASIQRGVEPLWLHRELGMGLLLQKKHAEALLHLTIYIEQETNSQKLIDVTSLRSLAATYVRDFDLALSDAEQVLNQVSNNPIALYTRVESLLALGQWKRGIAAFEKNLRTTDRNNPFSVIGMPLSHWQLWAFKRQPNIELWTERCRELTNLYAQSDALTTIEEGIVEIASSLAQSLKVATTGAQKDKDEKERVSFCWLEAWKKGGSGPLELALPLRLSEAAINFAVTNDERVLLALPIEERRIVQEMLNLDEGQAESIPASKPRRAAKPKQPKRTKPSAKSKTSAT